MPWVNKKLRRHSKTMWVAGLGLVAAGLNFALEIVTDPQVLSALGVLLAAAMGAMREVTKEPVGKQQ